MNKQDIADALNKATKFYGLKVDAFLKAGKYPSGKDPHRSDYKPIEDTKKIYPPYFNADDTVQEIRYGSPDAPYTAAYELGSGVHSQKNPGTYKIYPEKISTVILYPGQRGKRSVETKQKVLAVGSGPKLRGRGGWFPRSEENVARSPKSVKKSYRSYGKYLLAKPDEHVYLFYEVDHPGIAARPFAETVWLQEQNYIVNTFGLDIYVVIEEEVKKI